MYLFPDASEALLLMYLRPWGSRAPAPPFSIPKYWFVASPGVSLPSHHCLFSSFLILGPALLGGCLPATFRLRHRSTCPHCDLFCTSSWIFPFLPCFAPLSCPPSWMLNLFLLLFHPFRSGSSKTWMQNLDSFLSHLPSSFP